MPSAALLPVESPLLRSLPLWPRHQRARSNHRSLRHLRGLINHRGRRHRRGLMTFLRCPPGSIHRYDAKPRTLQGFLSRELYERNRTGFLSPGGGSPQPPFPWAFRNWLWVGLRLGRNPDGPISQSSFSFGCSSAGHFPLAGSCCRSPASSAGVSAVAGSFRRLPASSSGAFESRCRLPGLSLPEGGV
jgi:hypothetical protein